MSALGFSTFSVVLEVAIGLGAVLALCALLRPGMRVLIYRGAFAVAALAPVTLLISGHARPTLVLIPASAAAPLAPSLAAAGFAPQEAPSIWFLVLGVWLLGAAIVSARTIWAHVSLSRVFHASTALTGDHAAFADELRRRLGVSTRVDVRVSAKTAAPCAFGWARPKILLPQGLRDSALAAVLAHEFCHVRNGDAAWLVVERIACALHWFNPLIWLCTRRHRHDTELICDDAATTTVSVKDYATALVEVARDSLRSPALAAVAMSDHGLGERVRTLISRKTPLRAPSRLAKCGVVAGAMAVATLLGAAQIVSAAELGDPSESADTIAAVSARPARGDGLVFVDAPARGRVEVGTTGACWDGGRCVFEHRLGSRVLLRASASASFEWIGCEDVRDDVCRIRISETPAHVSLRLRE